MKENERNVAVIVVTVCVAGGLIVCGLTGFYAACLKWPLLLTVTGYAVSAAFTGITLWAVYRWGYWNGYLDTDAEGRMGCGTEPMDCDRDEYDPREDACVTCIHEDFGDENSYPCKHCLEHGVSLWMPRIPPEEDTP